MTASCEISLCVLFIYAATFRRKWGMKRTQAWTAFCWTELMRRSSSCRNRCSSSAGCQCLTPLFCLCHYVKVFVLFPENLPLSATSLSFICNYSVRNYQWQSSLNEIWTHLSASVNASTVPPFETLQTQKQQVSYWTSRRVCVCGSLRRRRGARSEKWGARSEERGGVKLVKGSETSGLEESVKIFSGSSV